MADLPITGVNLAYLTAFAVTVAVAILIYKFRLEPSVRLPLPNEEYIGRAKISLPRLGVFNDGELTTATRHIRGLWAKLIQSASGDSVRTERLLSLREAMSKGHVLAQRCGTTKYLYMFDQNPADPKFHVKEDKGKALYIHTQDSTTLGKVDEFEIVGAKIGKEWKFTDEERSKFSVFMETVAWMKLAANSKEEIKALKEQNDMLTGKNIQYLKQINTLAQEKADSDLIAGAKNPLSSEATELPKTRFPTAREFLTWPQIGVAALTFIIVPNIMTAAKVSYPEPYTVAIVVAFLAYILTPFVRKWFK